MTLYASKADAARALLESGKEGRLTRGPGGWGVAEYTLDDRVSALEQGLIGVIRGFDDLGVKLNDIQQEMDERLRFIERRLEAR